jgi:hypothetical protein
MNKFNKLVITLVFCLAVSLGANVRALDKGVKTSTKSTIVKRYGRNSYTSRSSTGVKTNTQSYGRNSYIQRSYSRGGALQSTRTIVPYGNGWLMR